MLKEAVILLTVFAVASVVAVRYEPNWESLDKRPLPGWYDQGKVGIFIHWGVFSVPSYGSEWFWWTWQGQKVLAYVMFMQENYKPDFSYADFGPMFTAEFYNPGEWADIIKASGAKYIVMVSKHHEGFTNWPSKYSFNWNAGDVGPNRDLVGDLADAVRAKTDVKFGLYHSMFEWFHPLFLKDQANNFTTQDFVTSKTMPELYEIVNKYKPDVVWSDGEWMAPDTYWNSPEFIAWLYNDSPVKDTVVVNDRWGSNTRCKHGGFWDCTDHYTPGKLVPHKWENCMTIDKYSWGYRRNARQTDYVTMLELLTEMVTTVSLGGNFLINIGPTSYGQISPIYEERLRQMGAWLDVNGEAIYNSEIWTYQNDTASQTVWYTSVQSNTTHPAVYAIMLQWPASNILTLTKVRASSTTTVSLLGYPGTIDYKPIPGGGISVRFPNISSPNMPCQWAWALRITGLKNQRTQLRPEAFAKVMKSIEMRKKNPIDMM